MGRKKWHLLSACSVTALLFLGAVIAGKNGDPRRWITGSAAFSHYRRYYEAIHSDLLRFWPGINSPGAYRCPDSWNYGDSINLTARKFAAMFPVAAGGYEHQPCKSLIDRWIGKLASNDCPLQRLFLSSSYVSFVSFVLSVFYER